MKLSKKQRAAFFAGDWPLLAGKGKPPVEVGYVCQLSSRLSFEVVRVHFRKGKWKLEYRVMDDRDQRFYLVPASTSFATDDDGTLADMPPEEEIGFTKNPKRRRADPLPTVPPNVQKVLAMRGRLEDSQRNPEREAQENLRLLKFELTELVKRATKIGVNPLEVIAPIAREIEVQHRNLREAA